MNNTTRNITAGELDYDNLSLEEIEEIHAGDCEPGDCEPLYDSSLGLNNVDFSYYDSE